MKKVCVFCGSRSGNKMIYHEEAKRLGSLLAHYQITLIYGGAKSGLMGALADAVLYHNGQVFGVMPESLVDQEIIHSQLTDCTIVQTLSERKKIMIEQADGFITLPGGTGTLDELSEVLCMLQVGELQKPIGLLNIENYFGPWFHMFDHMVMEGFLKREHRQYLLEASSSEELLQRLSVFTP